MRNKKERYYNEWDRVFIADPFKTTFTDFNGNTITDIISSVSVSVVAIPVDPSTGQPHYSVNRKKENEPENGYLNRFFSATIDSELGVLIIPNIEEMKKHKEQTGEDISLKVNGYTIDIGEGCAYPQRVSEDEFRRVIKEHFNNFNNSDNYHGQSTAYGYYAVNQEYPRACFAVGYDVDDVPCYVPYKKRKTIKTFYGTARTEERAKELVDHLSTMTPDEMWNEIVKYNTQKARELLPEAFDAE